MGTVTPLHCLRPGGAPGPDPRIGPAAEDQAETHEERAIICRACAHPITSSRWITEVEGKHQHTFFNPAGLIFEIACFSEATGCLSLGEPSTYFAWFKGCAWCYAICGGCRTHLGWQFLRQQGSSFYGLILSRLVHPK